MNNISNCPICDGAGFEVVLNAKDYTVSGEVFAIVACKSCNFHFTNPIPKPDEIGGYYKAESYVSHTSSKKGIINRIYHIVRKYTLKQKVKLVRKYASGSNTLDIGAGTGHFVRALRKAGFDAIGMEPDMDARNVAKISNGLDLLPIQKLQTVEKNSQDIITMWHVLEHVYDLHADVKRISEILRDNGTLIVAVPNRLSYDAEKYGEYWAAYDLPIHLYHFTPKDIETLFQKVGLELKEVLPMKFDSYYVSMLSEKYKEGNIINAIWSGFMSNFKATKGSYSSQIYILKKK
ncbi:MAG: class I SAM-dependent methyltransferase [Crocinitomicaceae bacterium]